MIKFKFTFTMKILQEETSSMYLLFTESKYITSENPLLFALFSAFKTWLKNKNKNKNKNKFC